MAKEMQNFILIVFVCAFMFLSGFNTGTRWQANKTPVVDVTKATAEKIISPWEEALDLCITQRKHWNQAFHTCRGAPNDGGEQMADDDYEIGLILKRAGRE